MDKNIKSKTFLVKIINYDLLRNIYGENKTHQALDKFYESISTEVSSNGFKIEHLNQKYILCTRVTSQQGDEEISFKIYSMAQLFVDDNTDITLEVKIVASDDAIKEGNIDHLELQFLVKAQSSYQGAEYLIYDRQDSKDLVVSNHKKLKYLKKVMHSDKLSFAYQPIIERASGEIKYHECLLRLPAEHSDEILSIGPFINIIESTGLNYVLDQIVLKMAVRELRAAKNVSISVNVSNAGVLDKNLFKLANKLLADRSIAERVIIEITETSLNHDYATTKIFIDSMRNLGCKVALDDYGSGFTSFKQLQSLNVDVIKIDGSFIRDIVNNKRNQDLVLALIDIAKQIGAKTVAEFVENGEIAKFLLEAGIDYMQGNFFSPAINHRSWDKTQ